MLQICIGIEYSFVAGMMQSGSLEAMAPELNRGSFVLVLGTLSNSEPPLCANTGRRTTALRRQISDLCAAANSKNYSITSSAPANRKKG